MRPDEDISRRYREIAREEPGSTLDDAILAASRRAVHRGGSRRWTVPVSIAAVLVLSFGLTLEMKREQPDVETSIPVSAPAPASAPEAQGVAPAQEDLVAPAQKELASPVAPPPPTMQAARPQPKVSAKHKTQAATQSLPESRASELQDKPAAQELKLRKEMTRENAAPAPAEPAKEQPAASGAAAAAPQRAAPIAPASPAARAAPAAPAAQPVPAPQPHLNLPPTDLNLLPMPQQGASHAYRDSTAPAQEEAETPETRELERIAKLRAEGREEEANQALEQFRRAHPGYKIPDAMWERVRPR